MIIIIPGTVIFFHPALCPGRIIGYDGRKIGVVRVAGIQPKMCSAQIQEQAEPLKEGMYVMEMDEL